MRVTWLNEQHSTYTGNAYLVRGDRNALTDVNTLVDPGRDPELFAALCAINTGAGKPKVEQVVLTHGHFDHSELLPAVCERWQPRVWAANPHITEIERRCNWHGRCERRFPLDDGATITLGDQECVALRAHTHSFDSVFLYCPAEGVLFTGDAPLPLIKTAGLDTPAAYLDLLAWLVDQEVQAIYPGHGSPVLSGAHDLISRAVENLSPQQTRGMPTEAGTETGPASYNVVD